jgi:hypothetical protein
VKNRKEKKRGLRQEERRGVEENAEELKTEAVQSSFF